jgi:hypothetical protein
MSKFSDVDIAALLSPDQAAALVLEAMDALQSRDVKKGARIIGKLPIPLVHLVSDALETYGDFFIDVASRARQKRYERLLRKDNKVLSKKIIELEEELDALRNAVSEAAELLPLDEEPE